MRSIEQYLDDIFEVGKTSDRRLQRYARSHIELLAADPRFPEMAADTLAAYEAYFGATNTESIKATIRAGLTNTKDQTVQEFKNLVSQHEGAVRSTWGKDTQEYLRFYPQGITEYRQASLLELGILLARYESGLVEHRDDLPPKMVADFIEPTADNVPGGVIPRLRASLNAQSKAKAETVVSKQAKKESRRELTLQLTENVLNVAKTVLRSSDTEKREALRLFPEHLITGKTRGSASNGDGDEENTAKTTDRNLQVEEEANQGDSSPESAAGASESDHDGAGNNGSGEPLMVSS